jgi:hypothetical protein
VSFSVRWHNNVTMAIDVTLILKDLLAANRGPNPNDPETRQSPDYGVAASLEGNVLDVLLTFKKDRAYCCMEWGCHLALFDARRWEKLHEALAESGVVAPPGLRLQLCCKIEEGAVFFDFSKPDHTRRGWYGFAAVAAHNYKVVTVEAGSE